MVKIDINNIKNNIENKYWNDAQKCKTGILTVLKSQQNQSFLKKGYYNIYKTLYNSSTGELNINEIKKLLLADKNTMELYIKKWGKYNSVQSNALLKNIFRFDTLSKRNVIIDILREMKVTVCPYCNRQYIFTLANGKSRPQIDHYYPKIIYPYLALSLYNMVPSCSLCNMSKSSLDTYNMPILYPYLEEMGNEIVFEMKGIKDCNYVKLLQGLSDEFIIVFKNNKAHNIKSAHNQIDKLHLKELYAEHKDYVRDIIKSKYVNSTEYLRNLSARFPLLFNSDVEVKNMLYMTDLRKEDWGKRPLAKLTHDIDMQIEAGNVNEEK